MIQKHIKSKNLNGSVEINKNIMADMADMIRVSPIASRILFLLIAYADDNNFVITNIKTIGKLLCLDKKEVEYGLNTLIKNGYIETKNVKLNHENIIVGVSHDKKLYEKTKRRVWKVIGEKFVTTLKLKDIYNKFHINENIIKCSNNQNGNIIKHIKDNLFYDSRINNNEIIWEM